MNGLFKITPKTLDRLLVKRCRAMHVLGEFFDCESDVRTSKRYCKAPTVLLYKVVSSRGSPSKADKLVD